MYNEKLYIQAENMLETMRKFSYRHDGEFTEEEILKIFQIAALQDISAKLNKLNDLSDISGRINGIWGEMRDRY